MLRHREFSSMSAKNTLSRISTNTRLGKHHGHESVASYCILNPLALPPSHHYCRILLPPLRHYGPPHRRNSSYSQTHQTSNIVTTMNFLSPLSGYIVRIISFTMNRAPSLVHVYSGLFALVNRGLPKPSKIKLKTTTINDIRIHHPGCTRMKLLQHITNACLNV